MTFQNWDIVVSKRMKDISVEAVVDFETDDWKVYISEWWRTLWYPTRIILDKNLLLLKDKKIKLTRSQFENLIIEYYWEPIDFFHLKQWDDFKFGDIIRKWYNKYMYIEQLWDKRLFWTFNEDVDWAYHINQLTILSREDLKMYFRTKPEIIQAIFGDKCTLKDVVVIEDIDWTPIPMED